MKKELNRGNFQGKAGGNIAYNSSEANNTSEVKQKKHTVNSKVLNLLSDSRPRNSRQISNELKLERTCITKALNDLCKLEKVRIAYDAKCPTTGRRTGFYSLAQQKEGEQLDLLQVAKRSPKSSSFVSNY